MVFKKDKNFFNGFKKADENVAAPPAPAPAP
jgi:hypothetical protein